MPENDSKKVKWTVVVLKLFVLAVLVYAWVWGGWSISSPVSVIVTLIGAAVLILVW